MKNNDWTINPEQQPGPGEQDFAAQLEIYRHDLVRQIRSIAIDLPVCVTVILLIMFYTTGKIHTNLIIMGAFLFTLSGIAFFRTKDILNRKRDGLLCTFMGAVFFLWGMYAVIIPSHRIFLKISLSLSTLFFTYIAFRRKNFPDVPAIYRAFLVYDVVLFTFIFALRVPWFITLSLVGLGYMVKERMKVTRGRPRYIYQDNFMNFQRIRYPLLGWGLIDQTKTLDEILFDPMLLFYMVLTCFAVDEFLISYLRERYEKLRKIFITITCRRP